MIELQSRDNGQCLILAPNHSASWQANKILLLVIALMSLSIAGAFAAIGAWLILPFAGLEVIALGGALYRVNLNLNTRQILWFSEDALVIEIGGHRPRKSWRWTRANTAIHVFEGQRLNVILSHGDTRVTIGEFLTDEDLGQLLRTLKTLGLHTRGHAPDSQLEA